MPEASPAARARRVPVPGSGKVWNLLRPAPAGPGGRRRPAAVGAPTRPPSPSSISPLSRPLLEGARSPQRSEPVPRRGSAPQLPEASGLSCRPMYWGRMWFRARSASLANRGWLLGHVGASLVRCQILNPSAGDFASVTSEIFRIQGFDRALTPHSLSSVCCSYVSDLSLTLLSSRLATFIHLYSQPTFIDRYIRL